MTHKPVSESPGAYGILANAAASEHVSGSVILIVPDGHASTPFNPKV
eukprot:CAMPEP_0194420196 /NCGR_PEP_ID=MMETSP0176-20130528/19441_1 /TAXON_ID=216777 /ORGANISM="Proboscia alata, Strain PI-D3" /LENGTH=46 /DNA_ID= /DNA_START= /DNA_END= /DNA_ORIENTATION=